MESYSPKTLDDKIFFFKISLCAYSYVCVFHVLEDLEDFMPWRIEHKLSILFILIFCPPGFTPCWGVAAYPVCSSMQFGVEGSNCYGILDLDK